MVVIKNGELLEIDGSIEEIGEDITKMVVAAGLGILEAEGLGKDSAVGFLASVMITAMEVAESKGFEESMKEACRLASDYEMGGCFLPTWYINSGSVS